MKSIKELSNNEVYRFCDLNQFGFKTTEGLSGCEDFIGQERAVNAIYFGLGMEYRGYNLYLSGPPGVGKTSVIKAILAKIAKDKPTPPDWCYVYNFQDSYIPKAISFPTAGMGKVFKKYMEDLVEGLKTDIPKAFESKEYEEEKQRITNESQKQKGILFDELQKKAGELEMQMQFTPTGIVTIPLFHGRAITQDEYSLLDEVHKEDIRKRKERIDEEVSEVFKKIKSLEKESTERVKELEKKIALFVVRDLLDSVREKYKTFTSVIDYLDVVQKHILENIDNLRPDKGIEARFGVLVTDFTMIHAGSLAKANGGYLVVEALDVLRYPFVWDSLKKVLENQELRIEDVYQQYGLVSTIGLRPEPIKLNVKVIMEGSLFLYHLLYAYDEDFMKLFKVKADFDSVVERTDDMLLQYACFIKSMCDKEHLKEFDRSGLETVIEYSSRLAGDQNKLSVQFGAISKIISEANYWASLDTDGNYVTRKHVEKAIEERIFRSNMIEEKIQEMIEKNMILVDTQGEVIGQINGLAVYNLSDYAFGRPSRITCETFMGLEGVVNIERKANLSGNIHNKGVLILSGYIGAKYAQNKPLSLS